MMWALYLVVGAFALYILVPFADRAYRKQRLPVESPEQEDLSYRRDEVLASINDLEYDFQMKKIAEPDYLQLKEKLTQDYIRLQKQLDHLKQTAGKQDAGSAGSKHKPERVNS
jgi:hypothetical protein